VTQKQEGLINIYPVTDGLSSKHTKLHYKKNFIHFLRCQGTDENTLIERANTNPRQVESMIINHIRHLTDKQGLGHGSIRAHCFSIFHFFEMNDINLNKRKIIRFLPPNEGTREDRAYSHVEINQILQMCDERSRVMILLMASTGMRIGAIPILQIGDLTEIPQYKLYKITVYASSPKDRYYTFCTPECKNAIDSYLSYRERFGEQIKPSSSPLIREQFDIRDPFRVAKPKQVTEDSVLWTIKQLLKRVGKVNKVKQSHGFRKFAVSMMIKAKVDYSSREYLVGHRHSRGLDVSYDRTSEEDRLQEYLKAVDLLTINPENRLKQENQDLKTTRAEEIEKLKWREGQQSLEIAKLKERLELQEQFANDYLETAKTLRDYIVRNEPSSTNEKTKKKKAA
jgi:integrase